MVGFKSFANKTKLEFKPGLTAIVGPNGCGKSNVSDAIRWVLGEQSAKALRGGKMQDVIFNGTEAQKPQSLAEVSLTLADCEKTLGLDYDEVRITRRVLRSGEGQYFINKTPCRLKDIQRLFMDTGVGTNSYSVMEQGKIDQILSSRPEDRRAVFEEASGITKYKADKKEALRKLEHTEANLLRLEDIIREVKRQIISLQRQAGKARRYKDLQKELRGLDIYSTRERVARTDLKIRELGNRLASKLEVEEALRGTVEELDQTSSALREELAGMEQSISDALDKASGVRGDCERAKQIVRINRERIEEMQKLSERDNRESEAARERLEAHRASLQGLEGALAKARSEKELQDRALEEAHRVLGALEAQVEEARESLNSMRGEAVDLESRTSKLQNELADIDARTRSADLRKERLTAEKQALERTLKQFEERREEMNAEVSARREKVEALEQAMAVLREQRSSQAGRQQELQKRIGEKQRLVAGLQAQHELLSRHAREAEGFAAGARQMLENPGDPDWSGGAVIGALADRVHAAEGYATALQASLRAWLDALVVKDRGTAIRLAGLLKDRKLGAARLLFGDAATPSPDLLSSLPGSPLIEHIRCDDEIRPAAEALLGPVRVVDETELLDSPLPAGAVLVTREGLVIRADGSAEYWGAEGQESNPIARRQRLDEIESETARLNGEIQALETALESCFREGADAEHTADEARVELEAQRRDLAMHEGELQVLTREAAEARDRAETVHFEIESLGKSTDTEAGRKNEVIAETEANRKRVAELRAAIQVKTGEQRSQEQQRGEQLNRAADQRILVHEATRALERVQAQQNDLRSRVRELESVIDDRAEGIRSHEQKIEALTTELHGAEERIEPLEAKILETEASLQAVRTRREETNQKLRACDAELHGRRDELDKVLTEKGHLEVEAAELRIQRQNQMERVRADYHLTEEQVFEEPEPEWEDGGKPAADSLETRVAEIRAKLESMGPVNLVAIEEHAELEERFAFLTQQQDDLVKAKQQLMDMIKKINRTTTELFSETFNKVNANFEKMFTRLFGGGTAKLVLVDEEDVLESGIEIIARPPGKKLQTISLLSGGERTMTAVALLFSLYEVKPSPFCFLDELDAALDESNIGRFVGILQLFVEDSQFIVITHNRQTIEAADVLYGVTMEKRGISKIVSVSLRSHEEQQAGDVEARP